MPTMHATPPIPHAIDPRPDTGFSNATLGLALFLASETMLFGALFSSYVLLRTGAMAWPHGWERLSLTSGVVMTLVLLASAVTMRYAQRALQRGVRAAGRRGLAITLGLALLFLTIELLEQRAHLRAGEGPARDTFFAIYFVLTSVHAMHVAGGTLVLAWLAGPGFDLGRREPARLAARTDTLARYWWFVDVVWLVLFVSCYLT